LEIPEARAKGISEAIKKLMGLRAKTALVIRDGVEVEISADDVKIGDLVLFGQVRKSLWMG
jgi:Cu+-exporting ATPase